MKSAILDEIEKMKALDKGNMINFCINSAKLYGEGAKLASKIKVNYPKPDNIIVAGMGGSGIGGDLLKDWARNKDRVYPLKLIANTTCQQYAGKKTLVLITSYSGDTEESLGAFLDALKRKCMIFCVSSGGALLENARETQSSLPKGSRRYASSCSAPIPVCSTLNLLEKTGLVAGASEELDEALKLLEKISETTHLKSQRKITFPKLWP